MKTFDRTIFSVALTSLSALVSCDPSPTQVTNTADGESGSLRAAINEANASSDSAVRIQIAPGTYELTLCGADDTGAAGDLDITTAADVTLVATAPGVVIKQTCAGERVLDHLGSGQLNVTGVTLTGGNTAEDGGAVRGKRLALSNVTLSGNSARSGGALAVETLAANGLTATGNSASENGGALHVTADAVITRSTIGSNRAFHGGGLLVSGALDIRDSRVTANTASRSIFNPLFGFELRYPTTGAGIVAGAVEGDRITVDNNALLTCSVFPGRPVAPAGDSYGVGILADTVSLTNSTLTNNKAPSCSGFGIYPVSGLAIYADSVTLDHVTIADNSWGSAIAAQTLESHRSLIVGSYGGTLCSGVTVDESSYNLIGDGSCNLQGPGDGEVSEILLAPLADNGGPVPTRVPSLLSDLVDAIPSAACSLTVDARGTARPQGSGCDVGAVEVQAPAGLGPADLAVAFIEPPAALTPGRGATWQLAVSNKGPNVQSAVVSIERPSGLVVSAISATGGSCSQTNPIVCQFPFAVCWRS